MLAARYDMGELRIGMSQAAIREEFHASSIEIRLSLHMPKLSERFEEILPEWESNKVQLRKHRILKKPLFKFIVTYANSVEVDITGRVRDNLNKANCSSRRKGANKPITLLQKIPAKSNAYHNSVIGRDRSPDRLHERKHCRSRARAASAGM